VSFRFGPTDGVSLVAQTWMDIVGEFGFDVVTIAGTEPADRVVRGLGLTDDIAPDIDGLAMALTDVDVAVVENLCTIPLNRPAAHAVAAALSGRRTLVHHHDPPWHRPRFEHIADLPSRDPSGRTDRWRHVTINDITAREMRQRGFDVDVIYNGFDTSEINLTDRSADVAATNLRRRAQRARLGVAADEIVVAHPVRAIERKNLPAAIRLAEELGAVYWLLGPPEEGYGPTMERLLASATCRVVHQGCDITADIYAAADVIAFPSTWEGFGNPPLEAALHRRPAVVGDYPFAGELRALGFRFFEVSDTEGVRAVLDEPDEELLDHNQRLVADHFSLARVHDSLRVLFDRSGWMP